MPDTLEAAWAELHDATPPGWHVGRPAFDERGNRWTLYAFDSAERPKVGRRSREWTAQHPTQIGVLRQMAYLREISDGRVTR
jgi:hypothetical protein